MECETIGELIRDVCEGQETVFDIGEGGKSLAVSRRKLQPELPKLERSESPPRAHVIHTAAGLIAYLKHYGEEDATVVLLDATTLTGVSVLDERSETQFETVAFAPQLHPIFREWQAVIGKKIDVLVFAEFCLAHRRQIVQPDGRAVALIFSQVRADKQSTIHRGQGKDCVNGIVVASKIQGGQVKETPVEIPDSLTIVVPLFVGEEPRAIEIDLLVSEANDQVTVLASASGVQEAQHAAFADMAAAIKEGLPDAVVALGRIVHGKWDYLKA